jgi:hypothetical protein
VNVVADDRTRRRSPDSERIDVNDANELQDWAKSLRATPEKVKEAVAKVGTSPASVRQYLRGK